ncbi:multiple sugar transport system ATP-binding protein [Pseudoduganella flava]|uniref:Multiple sugar transport system ATP-binding protein n=1 Tax=Pseudoduganella flava TaxID=871742 RepID=A0A562Q4N7_9BURK|nr:sn-glycerol-3-phosphate ABC transporter ATP-binding protein UgpC [Pseudoduganella flava]QGZ41707.1 sn-glycerol-3-phosphate ABC transporter ATP-binding protein UgpC [Pseudoduganella flava]TWI51703.1 multiple sugar transport system ATP-binding protein [Pseudoduganella flava]
MAGLTIRGVKKRFNDTTILHGIDLDIADGEFVVFVGPSGCGKSTLLRTICGLEEPDDGNIAIGGHDMTNVPPAQRGIAMVFQSYALYPHMTVYENMAFALKLAGTPAATIRDKVLAAAGSLRIEALLERKPKELSGGQRQRVAIGRAIVRHPEVFLFDEPLSNLDAALRVQMRIELKNLHRTLKSTMIYVTHDQVEAMTLADRIVVLRGGKVEQIGPPLELYNRPDNLFVAGFMGSPAMNFLRGAADGAGGVTLAAGARVASSAAADLVSGAPVTLGVRSEHVALADGGDGIRAVVQTVELLGDFSYVYLQTESSGEAIVARAGSDATWRPGQQATVTAAAQAWHVFDSDGKARR